MVDFQLADHATYRPDRFRVKQPHIVAAVVAGAIDISIGYSYIAEVNLLHWYGITLALKAMLVFIMRVPGSRNVRFHAAFLSCFTLFLILSSWVGGAERGSWLAAAGFMSHLWMTLAAVRGDALVAYLKAIAYFGFVLAVSYDMAAFAGQIEVVYGRYSFFAGSHPNLGSEILAMATVAACMSLNLRRFLLVSLSVLIAVTLMQGRAALLVVLLALLVRAYQETASRRVVMGFVAACVMVLFVTMVAYAPAREFAYQTFNSAFMIDDAYRGRDTGFVGRENRWMGAWKDFLDSPIVGHGFGYYTKTSAESAHNFYMYALVEFGLISILFFLYAGWCVRRAMNADMSRFLQFTPIFALTVFNDRFINLNPYPFVMIAVVLVMAVAGGGSGVRGWVIQSKHSVTYRSATRG